MNDTTYVNFTYLCKVISITAGHKNSRPLFSGICLAAIKFTKVTEILKPCKFFLIDVVSQPHQTKIYYKLQYQGGCESGKPFAFGIVVCCF